ncbi:hypothetical protein AB0N38_11640 [Micromonospora aurantiaca]|uniref:hypothetical protein n=1 Tax=Micromonospora aurantiaca (nom. illeg.) TaxID=47850 RepID=UPI00343C59D2
MDEDGEKPTPPADLRPGGLALWAEVTEDFTLGPDEVGALREACRTVDELDDLRAALHGQPMTVSGSQGQPVAHPLLAEVRRHRETLAKLLDALALPAGDEDAGMTPAQKRAQRAAQQRWRDRQAVKKAGTGGAA